jgi:hypothetical protein
MLFMYFCVFVFTTECLNDILRGIEIYLFFCFILLSVWKNDTPCHSLHMSRVNYFFLLGNSVRLLCAHVVHPTLLIHHSFGFK